MQTYRTIFLLIFFSFSFACRANQEGALEGTVIPSSSTGVKIMATQTGKIQSSIDATANDGKFRMTLPPGVYTVNVSMPNSPYPMTFPAVVIDPGKTATLPPISLAQASGHAVLTGRILPGRGKTTVTLYADGKERAAVQTDDGKYEFTGLPAGNYTLQAGAPDYAQDAVELTIADNQAATQNLRLLYAAKIDGIDWSAGKIRVIGTGLPSANASNPTSRRELARRAALADAERNLLKVLAGIKVGPDQSLKSFWGEKKYRVTVRGFIQGFQVVGERELDNGKIEVEVELPLTGRAGLTRYLSE
jgi:hypothetical protein